MKDNKFTTLAFLGDAIVTGDILGNITRWNLDQSGHVAELIGNVHEEIIDLVSHGLTTVVLTASGKVYAWSTKSRRIGFDIGFEILEGELIHVVDAELLQDPCKLDIWGLTEVIIRFGKSTNGDWGFLALDLATGEETLAFSSEDIGNYENLLFEGALVIGHEKVFHRDSGEVCAEILSAGREFEVHSDDYVVDVFASFIHKVNGIENRYAVVDHLWSYSLTPNPDDEDIAFDASDEPNELCINIISLDPSDISINEEFFSKPAFVDGMDSEFLHFKFKEDEAMSLAFYKDMMATITSSGDLKVFNYVNKERLHHIKPQAKPETDEFGNAI